MTPAAAYLPPADHGLDIIFRDDTLLVLNKPAGLLAVPGRGVDKQDSLLTRAQAQFPDVLAVHRLDMATSGLMVFARGAEMHSHLSRLFRERAVQKNYIAVVTGNLKPSDGEIALPLSANWPNRPRQQVNQATGKPSLTHYQVLTYDAVTDSSRVRLEPITGRTHQLRVHLAAIGHPIIGDALYNGRSATRMFLHASSLRFAHPLGGELLALRTEPTF